MTECANYTIKTLEELSDDPKHKLAPTRVVILSLLIDTWNKTPLPMGIPNELRELSRYADRNNLFVYHAGELIKILNIIKGVENNREVSCN